MILTFVISQQKPFPKSGSCGGAEPPVRHRAQECRPAWQSGKRNHMAQLPHPQPAGRSLRGDASRLKAWLPGQIHCPPLSGCGGGKAEPGRLKTMGYEEAMAYLKSFYGESGKRWPTVSACSASTTLRPSR